MTNFDSTITVHQALHGYSDGHNLLASSTQLSAVDHLRMLLLSDMSGSSMTKGFETYLTGFPLVNDLKYVLARTWYASEMERPGCVWTHSLLIDKEDLGRIDSVQALLKYFVRPSKKWSASVYLKPLSLTRAELDFPQVDQALVVEQDLLEVMTFVYEEPSKQILIAAANTVRYEGVALQIWNLQGSRLRRHFAFCTGAIENRAVADLAFDVQVIPERNAEKIAAKNKESVLLGPGKSLPFKDMEKIDFYYELMRVVPASDLREFLSACDLDFVDARSVYAKLLRICLLWKQNQTASNPLAEELVDLVADEFPKAEAAKSLKYFLFGPKNDANWKREKYLRILCTTKNFYAFSYEDLRIKQWAERISSSDWSSQELVDFLLSIITARPNPIGEALISAIFEKLDRENALQLAVKSEQLMKIILFYKPSLYIEREIWGTTESLRDERLDAVLSSPNLKDGDLRAIIEMCLERHTNPDVANLFGHFEYEVAEASLNWVSSLSFELKPPLPEAWTRELSKRPKVVLDWLLRKKSGLLSLRTLAFIASLLDENDPVVLEFGAKPWLKHLTQVDDTLLQDEELDFFAFSLSIAFSIDDVGASDIAAKVFLIVHNAARDRRLRWEAWQTLAGKLPELSLWQSWDRCERLRRGLIDRYMQGRISGQDFFRATDQKDVFEKVLEYATYHRELIKQLSREPNYGSPLQQKILFKHF